MPSDKIVNVSTVKWLAMKGYYDGLVSGVGPAGSMAAKTAAEKGLSVLLIEKKQDIRGRTISAFSPAQSTASG